MPRPMARLALLASPFLFAAAQAFEGTPAPVILDGAIFEGQVGKKAENTGAADSVTCRGALLESPWAKTLGFPACAFKGGELSGHDGFLEVKFVAECKNNGGDVLRLHAQAIKENEDWCALNGKFLITKADGSKQEFWLKMKGAPILVGAWTPQLAAEEAWNRFVAENPKTSGAISADEKKEVIKLGITLAGAESWTFKADGTYLVESALSKRQIEDAMAACSKIKMDPSTQNTASLEGLKRIQPDTPVCLMRGTWVKKADQLVLHVQIPGKEDLSIAPTFITITKGALLLEDGSKLIRKTHPDPKAPGK